MRSLHVASIFCVVGIIFPSATTAAAGAGGATMLIDNISLRREDGIVNTNWFILLLLEFHLLSHVETQFPPSK
jgi:hypothetical protein